MSLLHELGLPTDCPAEVVLTTFSSDGKPHASAMGVRMIGAREVELKIFTSTKTFQNIFERRAAVINFLGDPKLIVSQALKEIPDFEKPIEFEKSRFVNAPRLSGADAYAELEVKGISKTRISDEIGTSEVARVIGVVRDIEILKRSLHPFKMDEFFLLECAILATRAVEALKREKSDAAKNSIRKIESYLEECWKIAPDSPETGMITKMLDFLKNMAGSRWQE